MSHDPEKSTLFTSGVKAVLGFTLAYIAAAIAGALATGNGEFIIYIGIMAVLIGVVGLVSNLIGCTLAAALIYWHETKTLITD